MMDYSRGDIVVVNFNPNKIGEVGKIRPALIISGNDENQILDTIIVLPLSTQLIDNMLPYRLRITKREGLKYDFDILLNQIRTIAKQRIDKKIAQLNPAEYQEVIYNLCKNFK